MSLLDLYTSLLPVVMSAVRRSLPLALKARDAYANFGWSIASERHRFPYHDSYILDSVDIQQGGVVIHTHDQHLARGWLLRDQQREHLGYYYNLCADFIDEVLDEQVWHELVPEQCTIVVLDLHTRWLEIKPSLLDTLDRLGVTLHIIAFDVENINYFELQFKEIPWIHPMRKRQKCLNTEFLAETPAR